jgi:hypothetical protein
MQSLVTVITGVLFLLLIKKSFENLVIAASLALSIFTSSLLFVHFETTILTECLFANAVVLSFGSLACVLTKASTKRMLLYSSSVALLMAIRSTGIFILPIWLIVLLYVVYSKRDVKIGALFITPLILYFLLIAGLKSISTTEDRATGGLIPAIATNTLPYIVSDFRLPTHVNELIRNYVVPLQNPVQQSYIRHGKDVVQVSGLYLLYQRYADGFRDSLLARNNGSYVGLNSDYAAIADVARRKHLPDMLRFFEIQFKHYFDSFDYRRTSAYPFFESFTTCFREARIVNYSQHKYNRTGYVGNWPVFVSPRFDVAEMQLMYNTVSNDALARSASKVFAVHHRLFRNLYWVYGAALFAILSIVLVVRDASRRKLASFVFLICISNLVYMLVVSVNVSMIRYNFPLHFAFYAAVVLGIALLLPKQYQSQGDA